MPTPDMLAYYAQSGPMTDPKELASMFDGLPADMAGLCRCVQGALVHIFWAKRYGLQLTDEQQKTVGVRSVHEKLALLHETAPDALRELLPLERRQVGNCRDFTLLLTSILRRRGVPARARCGFGRYFVAGHYEDHWVCEYWDGARWTLVDAQLDDFQRQQLGIRFDPLDVPRDQFVVAGQAWQMCRQGQASPDDFGIFDMHGWWFIWGNVVRELLSFNKVEILPWDHEVGYFTHALGDPLPAEGPELAEYDRLAGLAAAGDASFAALRRLYAEDARLRLPAEWLM